MKAKLYYAISVLRHYLNAPLREYCYRMTNKVAEVCPDNQDAKSLADSLCMGEITWMGYAVNITRIYFDRNTSVLSHENVSDEYFYI